MKNEKGISLIETLIVSTLMLFVLSAAFFLIVHFGDTQRTQLAQTRLAEESRYMLNAFADQLKDAGAMLTLAHSNSFLSATPYFNGIFPLDKTNGPDGIIIASGDPNGATTLTANYQPSAGGAIPVKSTLKKDGTAAWAAGDKGILIASNGYYVFSVTGTTSVSLSVRGTAVYYSGLLSNCGYYAYTDTLLPSGALGNSIIYAGGSSAPFTPVIRLTNFSIYLFNRVYDERLKRNINRMFSITDTLGVPGTSLLTGSSAIVSDNICDMQLSYTFFTAFPTATPTYTFYDATAPTLISPYASETVYTLIQKKYLKEINVSIVVLTDEYGGKGTRVLTIPAIRNRASYTLPSGKYNFKIYAYNIQNKNFNIVI